jgi:hypothetical protein
MRKLPKYSLVRNAGQFVGFGLRHRGIGSRRRGVRRLRLARRRLLRLLAGLFPASAGVLALVCIGRIGDVFEPPAMNERIQFI